MRLGSFLWLALCVSLLGWYGWAMVGAGCIIILISIPFIDKFVAYRKRKKDDKERYQL